MWQAYEDAENNDETESAAMDKRDDVFYEYEKQFEDLGFKLVEE
jgi:hypothetical protein